MDNITSLEAYREEHTPYEVGKGVCRACNYNWIAVAPVGTRIFECPNCHAFEGRRVFDMEGVH